MTREAPEVQEVIVLTSSRRRPALALVSVVAASALLLTACGDDDEPGTGSSPDAAATAAEVDQALAAQVPAAVSKDGKIIIGTDATYPPNEFTEGGDIVGMDIDLGKAIGQVLGLEVEFVNAPFDSIIPGVQADRFELAMSSFTANAERQKVVDFATYFNAGTQWATRAGNPDGIDPDNACGKRIAVQRGTVQVDDIRARSKACTDAGNPAIDIKQYQNQTDATTAVVTGKDQAMLADSPITAYAVDQAQQLELLGDVYDSAPYGVVIPKDEGDYAKAVQGAIQSLIDGGQYLAILEGWGLESGAIETSEINPA
jgi:polar amino acid transport system substrate-binding protein